MSDTATAPLESVEAGMPAGPVEILEPKKIVPPPDLSDLGLDLMPDLDEAARFIGLLTGTPSGWDVPMTFQSFSDNKPKPEPPGWDDPLARVIHGTLRERARALAVINDMGGGVFVTVNRTDFHGRRKHNVTRVRALFIDQDSPQVRPFAMQPNIIVQARRGPHAYWRAPGFPVEQFQHVQRALAEYYGADPKVSHVNACMRLPGFFHRKAEPFMVRVAWPPREVPS